MAGAKNAVELVSAYMSFTTDSSRIAGEIKKGMGEGGKQGGKEIKKETDKAGKKGGKGFGKKFGAAAKTGMMAAGALLGAALIGGMNTAVGNEKALNKLSAGLALDPAEQAKAGRVAGNLYANAYGESMADVATAVEAVDGMSDLGKTNEKDLEKLTGRAMSLAEVIGVDVAEATGAAGIMMKNGLAKDGIQALDQLSWAATQLPMAARGELTAAASEYSKFFGGLGIQGDQFMKILAIGGEDGAMGVDKIADAVHELQVRAGDGSKGVDEALSAIGLSAAKIGPQIVSGGKPAQDAMAQIATGLQKIKDPALQAQTAMALFGDPLGELGMTKIPQFLKALSPAAGAVDGLAGASGRLDETLNQGQGAKLETMKRAAEGLFVDVMTAALPIITPLIGLLTAMGPVLPPLVIGLGGAAAAMALMNLAMSANPIVLVIGGIAALVGAIVWISKETTFFQDVWTNCMEKFAGAAKWVREAWENTATFFADLFGTIGGVMGSAGTGGNFNGGGSGIPGLATGGTVTGSGTVLVGEVGPELLHLPRGASVQPLDHLEEHGSLGGGNGSVTNFHTYNPIAEPTSKTVTAAANLAAAAMA